VGSSVRVWPGGGECVRDGEELSFRWCLRVGGSEFSGVNDSLVRAGEYGLRLKSRYEKYVFLTFYIHSHIFTFTDGCL
jgi:hypothetical protein